MTKDYKPFYAGRYPDGYRLHPWVTTIGIGVAYISLLCFILIWMSSLVFLTITFGFNGLLIWLGATGLVCAAIGGLVIYAHLRVSKINAVRDAMMKGLKR